jgi:uncharacterized protein YhfF
MATALLDLVVAGRKTATSWAAAHGRGGDVVGKRYVITDWHGHQRAVIETTELAECRFCDVDAVFARDEGEGDLSLEYWRKEHERFFNSEGTFSQDMQLFCKRFRLVETF